MRKKIKIWCQRIKTYNFLVTTGIKTYNLLSTLWLLASTDSVRKNESSFLWYVNYTHYY